MFCKYKDIFGIPGKGVHKYRLGGLAIVDVVLTILGGYYIHKNQTTNYSLSTILICLFISGIIFHWLFCVETALNKKILDFVCLRTH